MLPLCIFILLCYGCLWSGFRQTGCIAFSCVSVRSARGSRLASPAAVQRQCRWALWLLDPHDLLIAIYRWMRGALASYGDGSPSSGILR